MSKKILSLDELRETLRDRRLPYVAKESGVSYRLLLKLMKDESYSPRYAIVEKLSNYLEWKK